MELPLLLSCSPSQPSCRGLAHCALTTPPSISTRTARYRTSSVPTGEAPLTAQQPGRARSPGRPRVLVVLVVTLAKQAYGRYGR